MANATLAADVRRAIVENTLDLTAAVDHSKALALAGHRLIENALSELRQHLKGNVAANYACGELDTLDTLLSLQLNTLEAMNPKIDAIDSL